MALNTTSKQVLSSSVASAAATSIVFDEQHFANFERDQQKTSGYCQNWCRLYYTCRRSLVLKSVSEVSSFSVVVRTDGSLDCL